MSKTSFFAEITGQELQLLSEQQIENLKKKVRALKKHFTNKEAELEKSTAEERKWLIDQGFDVYQEAKEEKQWCRNCEASDAYDIFPCYSHCPSIKCVNIWMISWK